MDMIWETGKKLQNSIKVKKTLDRQHFQKLLIHLQK
jgi:hypothetical protein